VSRAWRAPTRVIGRPGRSVSVVSKAVTTRSSDVPDDHARILVDPNQRADDERSRNQR
jgi:hypothetical protein